MCYIPTEPNYEPDRPEVEDKTYKETKETDDYYYLVQALEL